jgi:uncharacterized protein (DUF2141 family)
MKNLFLALLLLISTHLLADSTPGLLIIVNKLTPNTGCLNLAMYDNAIAYNNEEVNQAYLALKQKVVGNEMKIFIPNLKYGSYSIQAFQDIDCTGRMEKGWFGIPKNGYGFSNNTRSRKYIKAEFKYTEKYKQQIIQLKKFSLL